MIILVISDTHNDLENAILAIKHTKKTGLDMVIHCGDHIGDGQRLEKMFPDIVFHYVPGNCDGWFFEENVKTKVIHIEDKKILFTHGDTYNIKYNYSRLFNLTKSKGAILGLCGHSHIAHLEKESKTGICLVNPGSITLPRDSKYPSYAIVEVKENEEIGIQMMIICQGKSVENPLFK